MKKAKWPRFLGKELIEKIKSLEPDGICVMYGAPYITTFSIIKGDCCAEGLAICSSLDRKNFSYREGKVLAAERAIKAFNDKKNSEEIRDVHTGKAFPRSWTWSQKKILVKIISILEDVPVAYKSQYFNKLDASDIEHYKTVMEPIIKEN